MKKYILGMMLVGAMVSGCATISEDQCMAGNWADIGYKDGLTGKARSKIADIAETCGKYGVTPDRNAYLQNYEQGVRLYCTFEQGFESGENGSNYNQVCSGDLAVDYAAGYDSGRANYEIEQEHKSMIADYEDEYDTLQGIRSRLKEPDLSQDDIRRLQKKAYRAEARMDDIRVDIRAFERIHDLPRYRIN